jgi:D-mannonate dehydratase
MRLRGGIVYCGLVRIIRTNPQHSTSLNTVEPRYNDIGLCDTSTKASDIL